jgi:hypothetical protein
MVQVNMAVVIHIFLEGWTTLKLTCCLSLSSQAPHDSPTIPSPATPGSNPFGVKPSLKRRY